MVVLFRLHSGLIQIITHIEKKIKLQKVIIWKKLDYFTFFEVDFFPVGAFLVAAAFSASSFL